MRAIIASAGCLLALALQAGEVEPVVVYPSAETLPANHLKFYLHFSSPMETGDALAHLQLFDLTAGEALFEPFRETELWDDTRQRLTLWLHPGRQKTGVNLNVDFGPILTEGHRYELRLLPGLNTSTGSTPAAALKTFNVGPRRAGQLSLDDWTVPATPAPGSRAPFTLRFPFPLDHALLQRCIKLVDQTTRLPIPGTVQTGTHEQSWSFSPEQPWPPGLRCELRVMTILEDLAGNSFLRPFEVDLTAPPPKPVPAELRRPLPAAP